jgi:hypothetical protein
LDELHPLRLALHEGSEQVQVHVVTLGEPVEIGRESALRIGAEPPDRLVSRCSVRVQAGAEGWRVESFNRNGVVIHPWGQPAWRAQPQELLPYRRVALRILGAQESRHWVLLEDDLRAPRPSLPRVTAATDLGASVRELTPLQREVLIHLFADLIAWPPTVPSQPRQLKQVARTLGVSVSAVQARLNDVRERARVLGLSREVPLTDPEYLYALVRAGYLTHDGL